MLDVIAVSGARSRERRPSRALRVVRRATARTPVSSFAAGSAAGDAARSPTRGPSRAGCAAAYGDWYRPDAGARFHFAGDALLGRTRGLLAARIDEIAPPGPVLDVGAGDGTLLDALRKRGREATGLERNDARPDFEDKSIEEVSGDGTWAAVVLWHSLEHLPRPRAAVRAAARLLKPGGVLAVAVPNTDSLQAGAFGDDWLHLDIPRHLVHLSTGTLSRDSLRTASGSSGSRTCAGARSWSAGSTASSAPCPVISTSTRRCDARRRGSHR